MAKKKNFDDSGPHGTVYTTARIASRRLRSQPTEAERIFWNAVAEKKLDGLRFNRQRPIFFVDISTPSFYIADFYCHSIDLIVEIDGPIHKHRWSEDVVRTEILESLGLQVIRFTNEDVQNNLSVVLEGVRTFTRNRVKKPSQK